MNAAVPAIKTIYVDAVLRADYGGGYATGTANICSIQISTDGKGNISCKIQENTGMSVFAGYKIATDQPLGSNFLVGTTSVSIR